MLRPDQDGRKMAALSKINWKAVGASITSMLTMLAALPYSLGEIATIIPPNWKSKIVVAGVVATLALRFWNAATHPQNVQPPTESKP